MRQHTTRILAKGSGLVLAAALFMAVLAVPARAAEVHVNINIGGPPPIFLHSRPHLVYLPQPAVYVAVGCLELGLTLLALEILHPVLHHHRSTFMPAHSAHPRTRRG